jgi:hypothetical protein
MLFQIIFNMFYIEEYFASVNSLNDSNKYYSIITWIRTKPSIEKRSDIL